MIERLAVFGDFEWDDNKAAGNLMKHGVSFVEAIPAILDPSSVEEVDDASGEARVNVIGRDASGRMLLVCTIERSDRIRIISARKAEPHHVKRYENG